MKLPRIKYEYKGGEGGLCGHSSWFSKARCVPCSRGVNGARTSPCPPAGGGWSPSIRQNRLFAVLLLLVCWRLHKPRGRRVGPLPFSHSPLGPGAPGGESRPERFKVPPPPLPPRSTLTRCGGGRAHCRAGGRRARAPGSGAAVAPAGQRHPRASRVANAAELPSRR